MINDQIISAVDGSGKFLRYVSKNDAHKEEGIHHLAITVFIFNSRGDVLLQKRKHKIFNNFWDNAASTHQLHLEGKDETDEEATLRTLKREYEINQVGLINLGGFNYFEKDEDYCENEFCKLLVGTYDGPIKLNPDVGYLYKWITKENFLKELANNPKGFTPWCKIAAGILKEKKFL